MKQLLLLLSTILCIFTLSLPANAQNRPTITRLSSDGTMTVYDHINCLETAIDDAKDGDKLYLSEGTFTSSRSEIVIDCFDKRISLIGSGYNTRIIPNLTFTLGIIYGSSHQYTFSYDAPLLDGLHLENIIFNSEDYHSHENLLIKNCYINFLQLSYVETATIESCHIKNYYCEPYYPEGICELKNCKIGNLQASQAYTENCNIYNYIAGTSINYSGIFSTIPINLQGQVFEFCILPEGDVYDGHIRECYRVEDMNTILDPETLEPLVDLKEKGYLGMDGTEVGIYGGPGPHFTELPSVPTVDSKKSTVEYDPSENKLKVNIQMLKENK